jgi:hypothetical protein
MAEHNIVVFAGDHAGPEVCLCLRVKLWEIIPVASIEDLC